MNTLVPYVPFDPQISWQSMAIAAYLWGISPDKVGAMWDGHTYKYECEISPWYNGRETGVCLNVRLAFMPEPLYVIIRKPRNYDGICIEYWEGVCDSINPPNITTLLGIDPNLTFMKHDYVADSNGVIAAGNKVVGIIEEYIRHLSETGKYAV